MDDSPTPWLAAVAADGVDATTDRLRAAGPRPPLLDALLAALVAQAHALRPPWPVHHPQHVARQLALAASELVDVQPAAAELATRLRRTLTAGPGAIPVWSSRRTAPAADGELGTHRAPVAATLLPDGRIAVAGAYDGRVRLWDPARPDAGPHDLGHDFGAVLALTGNPNRGSDGGPDGDLVVLGATGELHLCPTDGTRPPRRIPGRDGMDLHAVAVTLRDGRLVTAGDDPELRVYDPARPAAAPVRTALGRPPHDVAELADGRLAVCDVDGELSVVGPTAEAPPEPLGPAGGPATLVPLPDGRLVTAGADGRVLSWTPFTPGAGPVPVGTASGAVTAAVALADDRIVTAAADGRLQAWTPDGSPGDPVDLGTHGGGVLAVLALPDGVVVSVGATRSEGRLMRWRPVPAPNGCRPAAGPDGFEAAAVLPGLRVVSAGGAFDRQLRCWDPTGGARTATTGPAGIDGLTVLADGRAFVAWYDGSLVAVSADGDVVAVGRHDHGRFPTLCPLPDGRVLIGGFGPATCWDPAAPGDPVELGADPEDVVYAAAVLPDGRVVTGHRDGRLELHDLPGRSATTRLGRRPDAVQSVVALPTGLVAVSTADAPDLWLFDPDRPGTDGEHAGRHDRPGPDLHALPDGRFLSHSPYGRVQVNGAAGAAVLTGDAATLAPLPDGTVATGSPDGTTVTLFEPDGDVRATVACPVRRLVAGALDDSTGVLVVLHPSGLACWTVPHRGRTWLSSAA